MDHCSGLWKEALLNGEEDGPGQFGQEWPKDQANQEEWERDHDQESLFERPNEERGGEEEIIGAEEAGDAMEVEEN
ncbi:hypothetical protein FPQ18DRAFT_388511 [Pyronema domesticum]|nr:hypothetical protein FPQ18DRAFT_388511 [Pyronema domesticum]